ncbi:tetratricopeptide repeat protein [Persicimonas caeni]|nr:tetratricopeptide repeat protein [Persicimonas caeni]
MQPSKLGAEYDHLLDSLPATEMQVLTTARNLEIQGDADRACALLAAACERHPSTHLRKSLAALHQKHGNFEESARLLGQLLAEQPNDVPSVLLLAEAQLKAGRHAQARQTLAKAERLGASKLRLFKLEQQLPDTPDDPTQNDPTQPIGDATGPMPPLERETDPFGEVQDDTTQPNVSASGPTPQLPDDPSGSSVFEDGSFSNLSSFELAAGAAELQGPGTPSIFDTLVDTYDDDPADRSFDDLLLDLGVPVDESAPADPDTTSSHVHREDELVASQWGLDSPAEQMAGPADATAALDLDRLRSGGSGDQTEQVEPLRERTPRLHESPRLSTEEDLAEDDFADERTEMLGMKLPAPSTPEPEPAPEFPEEPPTQVHKPRARRDGNRGEQPANKPSLPKPSLPKPKPSKQASPQSPSPQSPSQDQPRSEKRPLPPSVRGGHQAAGEPQFRSQQDARHRPTARNRAVDPSQQRQPTSKQAPSPRHTTQAGAGQGSATSKLKFIVPGVLLTAGLALGGVVFAASSSAASAVEQHVATYRQASSTDTYADYLQAEAALEKATSAHSFLGAAADGLLADVGLMGAAQTARDDALIELAALEAMIEYRYEHLDTHGSQKTIERAEEALSGDPRLQVARAYRLLSTGRADDAIEALSATRKNFPGLAPAATAMVRAHLDAGNVQSAAMAAHVLSELDEPTVHQHYVMGLVERRQKRDAADGRFRHIIESLSPQHISARIQRSYTLRAAGDGKAAKSLLDETLGAMADAASPLQKARAHIAMGDLYLDDDSPARAEEQYRKALKAVPQRSEVYTPLIELYRDDGRLDKALELIEDAASQGAQSPDLALRRAELLRLTGRPESALAELDDEELVSARARWLEGMALVDLDRLDEASEAFAAATQMSDEFAPARAYHLLSEELGSREERDEIGDGLDNLLGKYPLDPHVLRAGALAAMHVAGVTDSRSARDKLLQRAGKLLERAKEHGGNEAVLLFDLCRQQMLAGDASNASINCGKGRRLNGTYLPGLLTMADLELRRGRADAVLEMLGDIADRFPDDPRISQWKALAHLERFEVERAEKAINRWAGTQAAKSPLHLRVEGRLAFARGRYTSALGYFQRAHEKAPDDARAALFYAHTLTRLGEHERAVDIVRDYTTDLEFEPVAWIIYGEARRRQGRFGDARENFGLALSKLDDAIAPPWRSSQAYTQLALAWADRYGFRHRFVGRYLYRGAKRGDADFPPLNAARGAYYLKQRRPDRDAAADAFEKVVEFEPFNCDALGSLRAIYEQWDSTDKLERIGRLHTEHCED